VLRWGVGRVGRHDSMLMYYLLYTVVERENVGNSFEFSIWNWAKMVHVKSSVMIGHFSKELLYPQFQFQIQCFFTPKETA